MSAKDNPGTLPINLVSSQPFNFGKIGAVQEETAVNLLPAREGEGEERSSDLAQASGDIVFPVPDARPSSKLKC